MEFMRKVVLTVSILTLICAVPAWGQWVTRDKRWPPRGPWMWAIERELPQLYREFNGIDFGHGHIAETLLRTQDERLVERARLDVIDFIFSSPSVPPDESQVAPTFVRMVWEIQKTFHWAHTLHRSLYDLFASDTVNDKEGAYRVILDNYLEKPEAITTHPLDHHGKLWNWKESRAFATKYPRFNSQIWAYHWLQAAAYDVQLMGDSELQRHRIRPVIAHYHGYLRTPPVEWRMMPMMAEAAPEFSRRFSEAAAIFDNLHMLHDNIDDVLASPELYPSLGDKRARILAILPIYLHRNHVPEDLYTDYHSPSGAHHFSGQPETRPPSVQKVLGLLPAEREDTHSRPLKKEDAGLHDQHKSPHQSH